MSELGRITKVDIRDVWRHEATDFSAWLSKEENLSLLSEELGLEIETIGTEHNSGRFRIDILGKDAATDHYVIIENQLEPTNHDHLGKVITYAAGFDAKYLIWIVREVLPEHQKAIDWLNDHLDSEIACFLVKLEVWKIGDSIPAPRFEVVSQKNSWSTALRSSNNQPAVTETKLKQLDFWQKFGQYIKEKDPHMAVQKAQPQHWLNFSTGTSGAIVAAIINSRDNTLGVDFNLKDKNLFLLIKNYEKELQKQLGLEFTWWEADKSCGARTKVQVADIFDEASYPKYFEILFDLVKRYKSTFGSSARELK